jgi:hypothetical protein
VKKQIVMVGRDQVEALQLSDRLFLTVTEYHGRKQPTLTIYRPTRYDTAEENVLRTWEPQAGLSMWKSDFMALVQGTEPIEDFLRERGV